jgi:hypothetical protein
MEGEALSSTQGLLILFNRDIDGAIRLGFMDAEGILSTLRALRCDLLVKRRSSGKRDISEKDE